MDETDCPDHVPAVSRWTIPDPISVSASGKWLSLDCLNAINTSELSANPVIITQIQITDVSTSFLRQLCHSIAMNCQNFPLVSHF